MSQYAESNEQSELFRVAFSFFIGRHPEPE